MSNNIQDNTVVFYTAENYNGDAYTYSIGQHVDLDDNFNDKFQSVKVGVNAGAAIYSNNEYTGNFKIYINDAPNINRLRGKISSFKIMSLSDVLNVTYNDVIFITEENYQGEMYTANNGSRIDFLYDFNDQFKSLLVINKTVSVKVYADADYNGDSKIYSTNQPTLGEFNNRVSSLEVIPLTQGNK